MTIERRDFLKKATATTAASLTLSTARSFANILGANDRVRLGIIGPGARGQELMRDFVKAQPCFQKAWLPESPYTAGQQHAADLDELLARAVADGATHLAVLHVDSWPVRPDWVQWIDQRLKQPGTVFLAVGAGHLAGKESVQAQLRKRGLKARRIWQ